MTITLNTPSDGSSFLEKETVLFSSTLSDWCMQGRVNPPNGITWTSDIDGQFAIGAEAFYACLCVGVHTITVAYGDDEATDSVTITITANEELGKP